MDPEEPESPISRLERSLWSAWCYFAEALSRFFRPAPAEDNGSDISRDSAADSAPVEGGGATGPPSPSLQVDSGAVCTVHAALRHDDSSELKRSNEGQESREEEFDPTGNDEAGLFLTEAHENKQHQTEIKKSSTGGGGEVSKTDEEKEVVGSGRPGGVVTGEDMEEFEGCAEDKKRADTRDGHQKMDEAETEDHEEGFETEDGEVKMCTFTDKRPEEEHQTLKIEAKHRNDFEETGLEQDQNGEQLQLIIGSENKPNEKEKEAKDQLTLSWKLLEDVKVNEATENQIAAEEPKMEDDRHDIFDQFVTSSLEDKQTTEVAHKEEDVVVTYVQTTAETEIIPPEFSTSSKFVDRDCAKEERLSREVNNRSISEKKVFKVAPDMVKPESETEQEISGEFKNIPMRIIEGQGVVPQERNPQACKEAQEGVPEHNNEFQPDENTTQRFREGGNCQEIQITQLPEKVGNKDEESLKNSRTGADGLLMKETKQASDKYSLDLDVELHRNLWLTQETEKPVTQPANLESEHLLATRKAKAEESSMKTEIKPVVTEFETYTDSADEADDGVKTTDTGIEGVLSDSKETPGHAWEVLGVVATDKRKGFTNEALKFPETKVEKKDMRLCQDFFSQAEKNSSWEPSLPEEVSTSELRKEPAEAEPTFLDDSAVEIENVSIDEMDEVQAEVQVRSESVRLEFEPTGSETTANFESSPPFETQEIENQFQDKVLEMNERGKADTGVVDKLNISESKELPELLSEKICEPFEEHQEVIGDDILDLWIEAAMSKEKDIIGDLLKDEPGETSLKETEQLVESNLVEFVSDASSTVESGTLLLSLSSGSLQDRGDICAASPDSPERKHQERTKEELTDRELKMKSEETACTDNDFGSSQVGDGPVEMCLPDSLDGIELSESGRQQVWLEDITEPLHQDTLEENHTEVDSPVLDFASQRSRIAVKNPRVRPPTNPRSLLQKPSADPTPPLHVPVKEIPGVPLGGLGIGFKLPGLGSGFPVLKKRQQTDEAHEDNQKTHSQEPEKPQEEEKREASQQDEAPHRPKWKPPGHLGFGTPLMSELKTKLKKTT